MKRTSLFLKISGAALMLSLLLAPPGCKKASTAELDQSKKNGSLQNAAAVGSSDEAGDFDYDRYGQMHNDGLSYLGANGGNPDDPELNNNIMGQFLEKSGIDPSSTQISYAKAAEFGKEYISENPGSNLAKLYEKKHLSDRQYEVAKSVVSYVEEVAKSEDPEGDKKIDAYIAETDAAVAQSTAYEPQEKDGLRKFLNVSRYSLRYWWGNRYCHWIYGSLHKWIYYNWWCLAFADAFWIWYYPWYTPWCWGWCYFPGHVFLSYWYLHYWFRFHHPFYPYPWYQWNWWYCWRGWW
jgi:hypothetical protein